MSSVSANFQNKSCDEACGGNNNRKELDFKRGTPPPAFTIKKERKFDDKISKMVNVTTGQSSRNNPRFSGRSSRNDGQRSTPAECSTSKSSYLRATKYRNDSFRDLPSINTSYSTSQSECPNITKYEKYPTDSFRELPSVDNTTLSSVDTSQVKYKSFTRPACSPSKNKTTSCSPECSISQQPDFHGVVSSTPYNAERNLNSSNCSPECSISQQPDFHGVINGTPHNAERNLNSSNSMRFASPFTSTVATRGSSSYQNYMSTQQHTKEPTLPRQYYEQFPTCEDSNPSSGWSGASPTRCELSQAYDSEVATTSGSMQSPASISIQQHLIEPAMLPRQFFDEHPSMHEENNASVCVGTSNSAYDLKSASCAGALPPHKRPRSFRPEYYETIIDPYETNLFPNFCRRLFTTEGSVHDPTSSQNTCTGQGYSEQQQPTQAQRSFLNNTGAYQDNQYENTAYADLPNITQHESTVYTDSPNIGQQHESNVYADLPNIGRQFDSTVYTDLPNMAQQQSFRERSPQRQRSSYVDSYLREGQQQQQRSAPCSRECSRSTPQRQQSNEECPNERGLSCTCDLTDERSIHNKKKQICKEASEKLKSFKRELEHELYVMEGEEFTEMDKNLKKWQKMRRKIMMKFLCVQFLRDLEKGDRNRSQSRQEDCPC